MLATLYDVEIPTINEHIANIFSDYELELEATIRNFRIVQTEGSRQVNREVKHYNLQMIIAKAYAQKLLGDEKNWLLMLNDRNITSHVYKEEMAEEIAERISNQYINEFETLLERLQ